MNINIKSLQGITKIVAIYFVAISCGVSLFSTTLSSIFFIISLIFYIFTLSLFNPTLKIINWAFIFYTIIICLSRLINNINDIENPIKTLLTWFILSSLYSNLSSRKRRYCTIIFLSFILFFRIIIFLQAFHFIPSECELLSGDTCHPLGFFNPFISSSIILIGVFILLPYLEKVCKLKKSVYIKWFLFFSFVLMLLSIFLLAQRACIIGLIVSLLTLSLAKSKKYGYNLFFVVLILFILSLLSGLYFSPNLKYKLLNSIQGKDISGIGCRLDMWKLNWQKFLEKPILGNGLAVNFNCLGSMLSNAHSLYLQQLVSSGIIGFISFAYIVFALLKSIYKKYFLNNIFLLNCLLCFGISGIAEDWLSHGSFWKCIIFFIVLNSKSTNA